MTDDTFYLPSYEICPTPVLWGAVQYHTFYFLLIKYFYILC